MPKKANFVIGGIVVIMTREQAERWNRGETTDYDLRTVQASLPDEYEQPSYLRRGGIFMGTPRLIRAGQTITLARATNRRLSPQTAVAMDGMPAERCGDWHD
jgi:hypothetical protein